MTYKICAPFIKNYAHGGLNLRTYFHQFALIIICSFIIRSHLQEEHEEDWGIARFNSIRSVENSIQHYVNIYSDRANEEYKWEMLNPIMANLQTEILAIDTVYDGDINKLKRELASLEKEAKISILIDAILFKTAFIPLRFPEICKVGFGQSLTLFFTGHIELKTKGTFDTECETNRIKMGDVNFFFDTYSNDLTAQMNLAKEAVKTFIKYSDYLPACEVHYILSRVEPVMDDLRQLDVKIMEESYSTEKAMAKKYFYFQRFLDDLKSKLSKLEIDWNAATTKEFNKFEGVSKAHCKGEIR